jgi:nucleoside phosphorylase
MARTERLAQLLENVGLYFDLEELRTLCFDLGVDYDSLRGEGKGAKARELLALFDRSGRIPELIEACAKRRPNVAWNIPVSPLAGSDKVQTIPPAGAPSSASVDVLLVTVTEVEARAVFDAFTPGQTPTRVFIGDNTYFDLGVHGNARVYMVQSEMGSGGLAGTQETVAAGIERLRATYVVMVGIAFGTDPKTQAIGDILVSRQLMLYEPQRVGTDGFIQKRLLRGDRPHASVRLVDRFVSGIKDWNGQKVHVGLVLSGEKLVDNLAFLQQLLEIEPEAIGGDMEGAGLYAAAQRRDTEWVLVKAICDWANNKGENKGERQKLAARNAAQFALHVIGQGGLAKQPSQPNAVVASTIGNSHLIQVSSLLNPFGDAGRITDPSRFFYREEMLRQIF